MRVHLFSVLFPLFVCGFSAVSAPATSFVGVSQPWPIGAEGDFGPTTFIFSVTRTGDLIGQCQVIYETRDNSAFAPEDYISVSGTVTFAPGQTSVQIPISVVGEMFLEQDETFFLALTSAAGDCSINSALGITTILNTEGIPPGSCPLGIEGDAGLDAAIRVNDLVMMRRAILGLEPAALLGCSLQKLDITPDCGDGSVNSGDVTILRQWILQGSVQRPNCGPIGPPPLF